MVFAACGGGASGRGPAPHDLDLATQPHEVAAPADAAAAPSPVASKPGVPTPTPPPAPPAPPDPATLERLAWPATTTSFVLTSSAHVYGTPDLKSEPLGKILVATRLPVRESLVGDKRCKLWLAAMPRGWICARYARPSTLPPEAIVQPVLPAGATLPNEYYGIKPGAQRFAAEDDVRAGIAMVEPKTKATYMVTKDEAVRIDGETYARTSVGLVATADLYRHWPSTFTGIDLATQPPPAWPFAWVIAPNRRTVAVRATADKKGAEAGTRAHREIVPVLEESAGFVRIADNTWIARGSLRIARKRPRPVVDGAHPRWLDLDRDDQVMIAYDGDTPVFATMFSSGRRKQDTPAALYRLRSKTAVTKMAAEEREASHYEVSEVPWATRFRSGLYFHAAYWHDQFGTAMSHGCVNLSPVDAKWVYDWTEPRMPPGWNELEIALAGSMVVRVHDAKHPDPPVFNYAREAIERVKIRKQEADRKRVREQAEAAGAAAADMLTPPAP